MAWSVIWLAFLGIPSNNQTPGEGECFVNYHRGLEAARAAHKPMLVIMKPGPHEDDTPVSLTGIRRTRERRTLLNDYVVVFIDTTTRHGQVVHKAYGRPKLPHVVILGNRQEYELFNTSEELYGQRWTEILTTFRTGEYVPPRRTVTYCPT